MRILVVDDEPLFVQALSSFLRRTEPSWEVDTVGDPEEAISVALSEPYDVVLVDQQLRHRFTGVDVIREIRRQGSRAIRILFTGCNFKAADKVDAVNAGADDHIAKSEGSQEISARIKMAVARRAGESRSEGARTLQYGPIAVNFETHQVSVDGTSAPNIRGGSYSLLAYLVERPERIVPWTEIDEHVFGGRASGGARNTAAYRLRRALGNAVKLLVTEPGGCGLFLGEGTPLTKM